MHESDYTCPRCRGGVEEPGLCRECVYIKRVFGNALDRGIRPVRGLDGLRKELGLDGP